MMPGEGWVVAVGVMDETGKVIHPAVDALAVEFIHAFPHRVEVWTTEEPPRLLAAGCLTTNGKFVPFEQEATAGDGTPVLVVVDILGVEASA